MGEQEQQDVRLREAAEAPMGNNDIGNQGGNQGDVEDEVEIIDESLQSQSKSVIVYFKMVRINLFQSMKARSF